MNALRAFSWPLALVAASLASIPCLPAAAMPPGFQKSLVFRGLAEPVAFEFLPDGRPIVAERWGHLVIINGNTKSTVVDIPDVEHNEEWGLLGLALDPEYQVNGFVYVYYTTASAGHICRVSRFTVVNDVADPISETIIWQNPQDCPGLSHHGGCIKFGPDGKLYIATGEEQIPEWSQNLQSQRGKIIRINADGSVPADNPYVDHPNADPHVYAYGFRNPFRFCFDPANGRMYVGDVGYSAWEEVDLVVPTGNYGWPNMEGPQCYISDCSPYTLPEWFYSHGQFDEGAAIILGPVCRSPEFPLTFQGNLVFADHVHGYIRFLPLNAAGHVTGDGVEFERSPELNWTVDLKFGPDGALYYTSINDGVPEGQMLWKIAYVGKNLPPVPAIHATPTFASEPPLLVHFSAAGSYDNDPDGPPGKLTFFWDFDDGQTATGPLVDHVYTEWGRHFATVTVSDGSLSATSAQLPITIGWPPRPIIDEPAPGATYRAGDVISFSGSAFDTDVGYLDPESLDWTVVIVHNIHTHPFLGPVSGSGGQFTIPDSGHAPEGTHFRITLTATDGDNITTTVKREIFPVISPLTINTQPPGIAVFLDGAPLLAPTVYDSVVNFNHVITAQLNASVQGEPYHFTGWSNGQGATFPFVAPEGGLALTASYAPGCTADIDGNGFVNGDDYDLFAVLFEFGDIGADINRDGFVSGEDFDALADAFIAGC